MQTALHVMLPLPAQQSMPWLQCSGLPALPPPYIEAHAAAVSPCCLAWHGLGPICTQSPARTQLTFSAPILPNILQGPREQRPDVGLHLPAGRPGQRGKGDLHASELHAGQLQCVNERPCAPSTAAEFGPASDVVAGCWATCRCTRAWSLTWCLPSLSLVFPSPLLCSRLLRSSSTWC